MLILFFEFSSDSAPLLIIQFELLLLYKSWEKNDYDFQDPKEFECRNFTQMIWKNSEKFGIGYYILEAGDENKEGNNQNTNEKKRFI